MRRHRKKPPRTKNPRKMLMGAMIFTLGITDLLLARECEREGGESERQGEKPTKSPHKSLLPINVSDV